MTRTPPQGDAPDASSPGGWTQQASQPGAAQPNAAASSGQLYGPGGQRPPRGGGNGRTVVVALVTLLVGLGAGLLLGGRSGGDNPDLAILCDYTEELPETIVADVSLDEPLFWRLQAVGAIASAAARNGGSEALDEHGRQLLSAVASFDFEVVEETLAELRSECE